jgi:outer membrane protein insertion porin family
MLKKDSNRKIVGMTISKNILNTIILFCMIGSGLFAQETDAFKALGINGNKPKEFTIAGISVTGAKHLDENVIIMVSGLNIGDKIKIPGENISQAIRKLWELGVADNVKTTITKVDGNNIYLNFEITERPRLRKVVFKGIRTGEKTKLTTDIGISTGKVITNYELSRIKNNIKEHYTNKGFLNCEVFLKQVPDKDRENSVTLHVTINKNKKVKIYRIHIAGNNDLTDHKVKSFMKKTKEKGAFTPLKGMDDLLMDVLSTTSKLNFAGMVDSTTQYLRENIKLRIFKSSKLIREKFEEDKVEIIKKYNSLGYRDARILRDSIYTTDDGMINIKLTIEEGHKYYFRNITWVGNTIYPSDYLAAILRIKKGDVYNKEHLDNYLQFNQNDQDVSSLYLDNGFLWFHANPVEVAIVNDSIDLEIRINEGEQARINKVSIKGNTRTNDHVAMREIRTRPGQLFSRDLLIRTSRELAQLRYFNPETMNPDVRPNAVDKTADIIYEVEETSSDQIELSGGWGYGRIMGSLGLSFNNFSLRGIFKKDTWRPIPSGDGQKLSLRFQTYGKGYYNYSISFTEPWLGGKKPNSFSVSYYKSSYSNGLENTKKNPKAKASFVTNGFTIGLGKRLRWPDDYFTLMQSVKFLFYKLDNYKSIFTFGSGTGKYNNISYTVALNRNSTLAPIYPRGGSDVGVSLEITPPYSLFRTLDFSDLNKNASDYKQKVEDRTFKWIEYYKLKFHSKWYFEVVNKLVLSTRIAFGYVGKYNNDIGLTPFGKFYLGGDGLTGGYNFDGREVIAMRGYENESLTPNYRTGRNQNRNTGGALYSKYTLELRYPLSLSPTATIYAMAYLEAGNTWTSLNTFDPFDVYRTAGFGLRIFMPMFGVLGLDWGYGFDEVPGMPDANGAHFHFSINQSID